MVSNILKLTNFNKLSRKPLFNTNTTKVPAFKIKKKNDGGSSVGKDKYGRLTPLSVHEPKCCARNK